MRKYFAIVLLFLFWSSAFFFFIALNFKLTLLGPEQIKTLATKSNFYEIAATYIKNGIVSSSDFSLNEGNNFENLTSAVTAESVRSAVDPAIDNFFKAVKDPTPANMTFPFSFQGAGGGAAFKLSHQVDLNNNLLFLSLSRAAASLWISGIVTVILLLGSVFLWSDTAGTRLKFVGTTLFILTMLLLIVSVFFGVIAPLYYDQAAQNLNLVKDPKLLAGIKRLLSAVVDSQRTYYIVEMIVLFVISASALFFSHFFAKPKVDSIDQKI